MESISLLPRNDIGRRGDWGRGVLVRRAGGKSQTGQGSHNGKNFSEFHG